MKLEICRKCPLWSEYVMVMHHEDLLNDRKEGILGMKCSARAFSTRSIETAFHGEKYELVKKRIDENRTGRNEQASNDCHNGSPVFKDVLEFVKDEHQLVLKEFEKTPMVKECKFYAEQLMEKWNNEA